MITHLDLHPESKRFVETALWMYARAVLTSEQARAMYSGAIEATVAAIEMRRYTPMPNPLGSYRISQSDYRAMLTRISGSPKISAKHIRSGQITSGQAHATQINVSPIPEAQVFVLKVKIADDPPDESDTANTCLIENRNPRHSKRAPNICSCD